MTETNENQPMADAKDKYTTKDLNVQGNLDLFKPLFRAVSTTQGYVKSAKAMETPTGCVIRSNTVIMDRNGTCSTSEAMVFVPDAALEQTDNGFWKLVPRPA